MFVFQNCLFNDLKSNLLLSFCSQKDKIVLDNTYEKENELLWCIHKT